SRRWVSDIRSPLRQAASDVLSAGDPGRYPPTPMSLLSDRKREDRLHRLVELHPIHRPAPVDVEPGSGGLDVEVPSAVDLMDGRRRDVELRLVRIPRPAGLVDEI